MRRVKIKREGAPTVDDLIGQIEHAMTVARQDPELAEVLYRNAKWFLNQGERLVWTQDAKDAWRYLEVCEALEQGAKWDEVFAMVSDELTRLHHGAAAGEDQVRKSYQRVQAKLPPEQKRPRTYRPLG